MLILCKFPRYLLAHSSVQSLLRSHPGQSSAQLTLTMFSLVLMALMALGVSGFSSHQLTVEVEPGREECYYQFLDLGQTLTVDYEVLDTSGEIASLDIDFNLSLPSGEAVVVQYRREDGRHSFAGGDYEVGDYKICFNNKFSVLSSKLVLFEVIVEKEEEKVEERRGRTGLGELWEYQETAEELDTILFTIRKLVVAASGVQTRMLVQHGKDRMLADRKIRRVNNMSFVMVSLIVLGGLLQVFMIRRLFEVKY